jgi:hypothetical protein
MWNLSTSFGFCLLSKRGVQALAVKGTPEALRQATSAAKDSSSHDVRHPGAFEGKLAQFEITQNATSLIRQACGTA